METDDGSLARCICARGVVLAAMTKNPGYREPVIGTEFASICVGLMAAMPDYFPPELGARMAIGRKIRAICESEEAADWLAMRMVDLFRKWPGVDVMRQVYCAKYRHPLDGIAAIGVCEEYPDGFPSERAPEPEPKRLLLPRSRDEELLSAAPEMEIIVSDLAAKTRLDRTLKRIEPPPRELSPEERKAWEDKIREAEEQLRAQKDAEIEKSIKP
jgi:hypothetical protein